MGGEVYILPAKGEAKKIKEALKVIDDQQCIAPMMEWEKYPADCWFQWRGNCLEIGYSFGNMGNGEWAYALGQEICRRFKIKNAGWSAVGYCGLKPFMKSFPFRAMMEGPMKLMKDPTTPEETRKCFKQEIMDMRKASEKYVKAAALIFDYKEKKNGKAKQAKSNRKADCCS
jgi:hypothetical protein